MSQDINSDEQIIAGLKRGESKAFDYFFDRHYAALRYFIEKFVKSSVEAEDLAIESFIKLWKSSRDFESLKQVRSYLYTVSKNSCIDYLHQKKRIEEVQKEYAYLSDNYVEILDHIILRTKVIELINEEIQKLPPKYKTVFELYFFESLTSREIAEKLNMPESTVKSQKNKALDILRMKIGNRNLVLFLMLLSGILHSAKLN